MWCRTTTTIKLKLLYTSVLVLCYSFRNFLERADGLCFKHEQHVWYGKIHSNSQVSSNTHWAPQQSPINGDVEEKLGFLGFFLLKLVLSQKILSFPSILVDIFSSLKMQFSNSLMKNFLRNRIKPFPKAPPGADFVHQLWPCRFGSCRRQKENGI